MDNLWVWVLPGGRYRARLTGPAKVDTFPARECTVPIIGIIDNGTEHRYDATMKTPSESNAPIAVLVRRAVDGSSIRALAEAGAMSPKSVYAVLRTGKLPRRGARERLAAAVEVVTTGAISAADVLAAAGVVDEIPAPATGRPVRAILADALVKASAVEIARAGGISRATITRAVQSGRLPRKGDAARRLAAGIEAATAGAISAADVLGATPAPPAPAPELGSGGANGAGIQTPIDFEAPPVATSEYRAEQTRLTRLRADDLERKQRLEAGEILLSADVRAAIIQLGNHCRLSWRRAVRLIVGEVPADDRERIRGLCEHSIAQFGTEVENILSIVGVDSESESDTALPGAA